MGHHSGKQTCPVIHTCLKSYGGRRCRTRRITERGQVLMPHTEPYLPANSSGNTGYSTFDFIHNVGRRFSAASRYIRDTAFLFQRLAVTIQRSTQSSCWNHSATSMLKRTAAGYSNIFVFNFVFSPLVLYTLAQLFYCTVFIVSNRCRCGILYVLMIVHFLYFYFSYACTFLLFVQLLFTLLITRLHVRLLRVFTAQPHCLQCRAL